MINPLQDAYSELEIISRTQTYSHGYTEATFPARAARVSHGNHKEFATVEEDEKLINYLAEHKHYSCFEHQSVTFRVKCPLFVAREWMRHRTQSFNEISMRYTADPVGQCYHPLDWRKQASSNRQSSEGHLSAADTIIADRVLFDLYQQAEYTYQYLIELGVARELARIVVPVGNYTEFYATANLRNWAHFVELRSSEDAQYEIRRFSEEIDTMLSELWPTSWGALRK